MKELLYYEIRKMMAPKAFVMVMLLVMIVPMIASYSWLPSTYVQDYQRLYSGIVSEEWYQPILKEYEEMIDARLKLEENNSLSMLEEPANSHNNVLSSAYVMGSSVLNKGWREQEFGHSSGFRDETDYTKERTQYVSGLMEEVESYKFGDTRGLKFIVTSIFVGTVIITCYMMYLMARIFNRENQEEFLDLMKTCKIGKRSIGKVKIGIVVMYPIVFSLITFLMYVIIGTLCYQPDFDISVLSEGYTNPFTYKEQIFYAILLGTTAICAMSVISASLSLWIKSSFQSFGAAIVFFLIPMFLPRYVISGIPISSFLPTNFSILMDTVQYDPYLFIRGNGFLTAQFMPVFYSIVMVVVCIVLYIKFQRKSTN